MHNFYQELCLLLKLRKDATLDRSHQASLLIGKHVFWHTGIAKCSRSKCGIFGYFTSLNIVHVFRQFCSSVSFFESGNENSTLITPELKSTFT